MRRGRILCGPAVAALLLTILIASGAGAEESKVSESPLTLTKVALFKSGVGYFELQGSVRAGEGIPLHFKREQMNDLLKSLTVIDLSGGGVSSIVYDSTKTTTQALRDYTFALKKGDGLPQVLQQLQGSPIQMVAGSVSLKGTLVGVERRMTLDGDAQIPVYYLSMIDSNGQLRSFDTEEIAGIRFLNERLNQDLETYLSILFQKHRKDEKTVRITPTGHGTQKLLVSYVTEAPVWKATYRIVLPVQPEGKKPFLQGWAIVDNVSGQDWKDIQLSLVSGLPISFVQNLYDPQFRKRPVVEIERDAPVVPALPEAGMLRDRAETAAPVPSAKRKHAKAFAAGRVMAEEGIQQVNIDERMRQLRAETVTREVGEMFAYTMDHPVTIERNRSALVPIVGAEINGEAVDLYNEEVRPTHPLSAVRLKNSTGLTLEGGAMTVFQGGSYAGDALMNTLKPDEQRYITYAVDLGLHVNTRTGSKTEAVDRVIINRGVLRMHRGIIETKTYTLGNKAPRMKRVIIDHPYHPNWKLLNPEKPVEITDHYIRFEVNAPGKETTTFTVREMRDSWERIMVSSLTPDYIAVMAGKHYLSEKARIELDRIVALKADISTMDRALKTLNKARQDIFDDQKRLRENLKGLGQTPEEKELRSRYVRRLNEQETRLEKERKREAELEGQRRTKQKELDERIAALEQDLSIQGS